MEGFPSDSFLDLVPVRLELYNDLGKARVEHLLWSPSNDDSTIQDLLEPIFKEHGVKDDKEKALVIEDFQQQVQDFRAAEKVLHRQLNERLELIK